MVSAIIGVNNWNAFQRISETEDEDGSRRIE
jgi:hypothetical protein